MTPPTIDPAQLPLRDIHLPAPIPWWPPAPGWWLLLGLLLLGLLLYALWRWIQRRRLLITLAHQEWKSIEARFQASGNHQQLAAELSALLRRVALARFPRAEVAALSGEAWLEFLDQTNPQRPFSQGAGRAITEWAYDPKAQGDDAALLNLCRTWINKPPCPNKGKASKDGNTKDGAAQDGVAQDGSFQGRGYTGGRAQP